MVIALAVPARLRARRGRMSMTGRVKDETDRCNAANNVHTLTNGVASPGSEETLCFYLYKQPQLCASTRPQNLNLRIGDTADVQDLPIPGFEHPCLTIFPT